MPPAPTISQTSATPAAPPRPGAPGTPRHRSFVQLLGNIAWAAAGVHLVFLALFVALDATVMVMANIVSVATFVLAALLVRAGHWRSAAYLMVGEVLAHAALAVLGVGWEAGFHLYLMVLIPTTFQSRGLPAGTRWRIALCVITYILSLRWASSVLMPWHPLPEHTTLLLQSFNIAMSLLLLAQFAFVYSGLVTRAEEQLARWATTDALTGLANRRGWLEQVELAQSRQRRQPTPLSIVLADIDHFKAVNDLHGHEGGDLALRAVARTLEATVREADQVARWGGEEFIVLLHGADLHAAVDVAEHLRAQIQHIELTHQGRPLLLSMSFGVTELHSVEPLLPAIRRADDALYAAKDEGRNRVRACATPRRDAPDRRQAEN